MGRGGSDIDELISGRSVGGARTSAPELPLPSESAAPYPDPDPITTDFSEELVEETERQLEVVRAAQQEIIQRVSEEHLGALARAAEHDQALPFFSGSHKGQMRHIQICAIRVPYTSRKRRKRERVERDVLGLCVDAMVYHLEKPTPPEGEGEWKRERSGRALLPGEQVFASYSGSAADDTLITLFCENKGDAFRAAEKNRRLKLEHMKHSLQA